MVRAATTAVATVRGAAAVAVKVARGDGWAAREGGWAGAAAVRVVAAVAAWAG